MKYRISTWTRVSVIIVIITSGFFFASLVFGAPEEPPVDPGPPSLTVISEKTVTLKGETPTQIPFRPDTSQVVPDEIATGEHLNKEDMTQLNGVMLNAYARSVAHEGQQIVQIMLYEVVKDGKKVKLKSSAFSTQYTAEQPVISQGQKVTLSASKPVMMSALAEFDEKKEVEGDTPNDQVEVARPQKSDQSKVKFSGAGAGQALLPKKKDKEEETDETLSAKSVSTGCKVRVDYEDGYVIQQKRQAVFKGEFEDSTSNCLDSDEKWTLQRDDSSCEVKVENGVVLKQYRFFYVRDGGEYTVATCEPDPSQVRSDFEIVRSYDCRDKIDRQNLLVYAQFSETYTNSEGEKVTVNQCQTDPNHAFPIREDVEGCDPLINGRDKQVTFRSRQIYVSRIGLVEEVSSCQPKGDPVPLTYNTEVCPFLHDYEESVSTQQGQYLYQDSKGMWFQASDCQADTKATFEHTLVYQNSDGSLTCPPVVDWDDELTTPQFRRRIEVAGVGHWVRGCEPETTGVVRVKSTTEGCDDPATWRHDLRSKVSYNKLRYYYAHGREKHFVTDCQEGNTVFQHKHLKSGYQNHDAELYAYMTVRVLLPEVGNYVVNDNYIPAGTPKIQYVGPSKLAEKKVKTHTSYEHCTFLTHYADYVTYRRPDTTSFLTTQPNGNPDRRENQCTKGDHIPGELISLYHNCREDVWNKSDKGTLNIYHFDELISPATREVIDVAARVVVRNKEKYKFSMNQCKRERANHAKLLREKEIRVFQRLKN